MIIYFADRYLKILGQASTSLPDSATIRQDKKTEDIDTGVASFSCYVNYKEEDRIKTEEMATAGNYLLRKCNNKVEFYTIIESETDSEAQDVYVYAEDAGLDLLNEIASVFEADAAHPIAWYVEKWTEDSGFEIGINEIPDLTRKLKWEGESTVTERLASIATQFDNAEIGYDFDIEGMTITHKYINIYKKRGKDIGEELRAGKHLSNIIVKKSVANLATALRVTGGTPEGKEDEITLKGYSYDDGDFYVDTDGILKSRKAVEKWTRYCWEKKIPGYEGHIEKTYSYDTTNQQTLCAHAVTKLKSICEPEVNYEAEIAYLPDSVRIGDRVNIVDDGAKLYVSARVLKLETSQTQEDKATFGEYLIKDSGIDARVEELASQFAQIAKNRVLYMWIAYADDESGSGISLDSEGKAYIGICTNKSSEQPDITNPSVYKWTKIEGSPGKSITGRIEHYLVSSLSEGITIQTSGWSTDVPAMSAENKYLWNYETFVYSDGTQEDLEPKIIGAYGDTGKSGDDGKAAPYIVKMTRQYYLSASETELSGGEWVRVLPDWATGKYLWTRWCTEWSEPNPTLLTYSDAVLDKSWNEVHETAKEANTKAAEAKANADDAKSQVLQVNSELATVNAEINALAGNLETLENTMSTDYAKKQELTEVESTLASSISQNAAGIASVVSRVDQVNIDVSAAQTAADAAQSAADAAEAKAKDAQDKYTALKSQTDATDEELAAAKAAVEQAQKDATAAGDAAAAAKSLADSLEDRTTKNETAIQQNADSIGLVAETASSAVSGLTSAKSEWDVKFQGISGRVETTEKWQTDKDELIGEMQKVTEFLIEDGEVKFNFNKMLTDIENNGKELQKQTRYVQIVEDATEGATIVIGDSQSGMVAEFTKTALTFKNGDVVLATYANDGLTVENITTRNQLMFEGRGWAIRPGREISSGKFNLNDVWIGG